MKPHEYLQRRCLHLGRLLYLFLCSGFFRLAGDKGGNSMGVLTAFQETWKRRGFVVSVFLVVRIFSLALILPLTGAFVSLVVALSGQSALTDQDIAHFIFSPIGFAALLGIGAVLLIGSVIGVATMTVGLQDASLKGISALHQAILKIGARLPSLILYAVQLVLRVLVIVVPFAVLSLLVANRLIGEFDINYYLSEKPPELFLAGGIIGLLLAVMACILINRLSLWAVSLHLVLFGDLGPAEAFRKSSERMLGKRVTLLRSLGTWLAIRVFLTLLVGLIFGWLLQQSTADFDSGFRLKLAVSVLISILWLGAGVLVAAISLGALAGVLNSFYGAADRSLPARESVIGLRGLLIGFSALSLIGLIWVTVLIDDVESETTVEIIAHRGAAGLRPENTLASIRKAIEDGTDWVEIDVQETADGEVFVLHDSYFMKLAGVNLKIWDASMDDLADIDIGSWFDAVYSEERTPRLAEVLETVRDKAGLLIELKYYGHDVDLEARTIALVEEAGMRAQVATMSLKYPAVQKMKTLRPDWPSGVLAATAVGNLAQLDGEFIAVSTALVGPKLVRATHAKGKKLFVWTVNDPLEMMSMISMGVDGLITDEPALARKVIDIRADLSTPERVFILFMERFNLTAPEDKYRDASP